MPTVDFRVTDETGAQLQAVRVALDEGKALALTSEPLSVDPGEHQFTFEAEGYSSVTRNISLSEAEAASVEIRLTPACAKVNHVKPPNVEPGDSLPEPFGRVPACIDSRLPQKRESSEPIPAPAPAASSNRGLRTALVLSSATVGALGGIGLAYFGLNARQGEHNLEACSPNCSGQAVDSVRRDYVLANASLAVGLVGFVAMGVVLLTGNPAPPATRRASAPRWDVRVGPISTLTATF
jgi:hypothetical protein